MLQQYLMQQQDITLGWQFFVPLVFMVVLILLAVRIWVVVGIGALAMLYFTDVLPLTLLGEALFDGIDSFALIAVPLFILTGDVLVRTGLSNRLLDVAEATLGARRSGLGTSTVLGCGFFACISGSDAADAAAISRITIDRLVDKGYPRPYACALVAAGARDRTGRQRGHPAPVGRNEILKDSPSDPPSKAVSQRITGMPHHD